MYSQHLEFVSQITLSSQRQLELHRESEKGCHPNHGYNFVNSRSISKIPSLLQWAIQYNTIQWFVKRRYTICPGALTELCKRLCKQECL